MLKELNQVINVHDILISVDKLNSACKRKVKRHYMNITSCFKHDIRHVQNLAEHINMQFIKKKTWVL